MEVVVFLLVVVAVAFVASKFLKKPESGEEYKAPAPLDVNNDGKVDVEDAKLAAQKVDVSEIKAAAQAVAEKVATEVTEVVTEVKEKTKKTRKPKSPKAG